MNLKDMKGGMTRDTWRVTLQRLEGLCVEFYQPTACSNILPQAWGWGEE